MDFKHLLDFLTRLNKNNNKEWFDANKKEYEALRKEWIAFVADSIQAFGAFDPKLLALEPKQCIFRINRDIRFSKDKSPYKNNFGMSLTVGGKKDEFCGYYLHIQPGACFIAGGAYQPMPDKLAAIRQEIDYNFDSFKKIVTAKEFKAQFGALSGDKLSRPPKGYDAENPAVDYLKHKGFIAQKKLDDKTIMDKNNMKELVKSAKTMKPMIDFLREAINA
ncbi:MAG: DUF2461 domain-containing protein [Bacteroidota bacterium]